MIRPLVNPYSMNAAVLTVAEDDYTEHVSQVELAPSTQTSRWRSIGGHVRSGQSVAEWTLTLGLAQDLSPDGLLRYLHANEGRRVTVALVPDEDGPTVTASVILSPGTIGGTAGSDLATATATLAVDGRPEFVDPA